MTIAPSSSTPSTIPADAAWSGLRSLYFARFAFAIVWAGVFALVASPFRTAGLVLAVIYPAVDVVAAMIDARSTGSEGRSRSILAINVLVSTVAAAAILAVGTEDVGDILLVWGVWAIVSGLTQLAVGILRRARSGQWPLIVSGSLSVLAGTSFALSAGGATSVTGIAGYAILGGVFFLVSALRIRRP